jgi:excisionase family DNA binding protein
MSSSALEKRSIVPTAADVEVAKACAGKILDMTAEKASPPKYTVTDNRGTTIELSESVFRVLIEALKAMAQGNAVMLAPIETEVTTQQAAELLNVSRPYLVSLLEQGKIPFRTVGRYRRIKLQEILDYQAERSSRRQKAMDEMVAQSQALDMGY